MKEVKMILLILISLQLRSQNYTIIYESTSKYSKEIVAVRPDIVFFSNRYRYSLHVIDQSSIFRRDSILISEPYEHGRMEIWPYEQIYKNHRSDIWLKTSASYRDGYGYHRSISELTKNNKFHWVKTGIKTEILGFICTEVKNENKTAYYTTQIPLPDGPHYGNFGLPGLVLAYEDESGIWKAVAIKLNESIDIIGPKVIFESNESKIKMSVFELKDLPKDKAIRIDNTTPIKKWIKFK